MPIYAMSCFKPAPREINALESFLKKFLLEGVNEMTKIPLLNWEVVCKPKEYGGAGLRKMEQQNLALGAKLVWKLYRSPNKLWCRIMQKKYLDNNDPLRILAINIKKSGSAIWKFIKECRHLITNHISWKIGNGKKTKFWHDSWNRYESIKSCFEENNWIGELEGFYGVYVADYVEDAPLECGGHVWKEIRANDMGIEWQERLMEIIKQRKISLNKEEDEIIWCAARLGEYKVKLGYQLQSIEHNRCEWASSLCWDKFVAPRAGAFLWTTMHGRMLTGERLKTYRINGPSRCVLCKIKEETIDHLLYDCRLQEIVGTGFIQI